MCASLRMFAIVLVVTIGACFGGIFHVKAALAATGAVTELACPTDLEQSGALCYPKCQEGYYGDGPLCVKRCPIGYTDDIALCRKDAIIFAKASYGRGAGTVLVCAANQEAQSGLCYPRCIASHYGVGPVCWQRCPAGYADHGATCYRGIFDFLFKNTYGRGAGVAVSTCAVGLERNGSLCYPRCATGYSGNGPVCFKLCPVGYKDDGAVCRLDAVVIAKETSPRGAGVVLNTVPEAIDATFTTPKNTPVTLAFEHDDFDDDQGLPTIIVQQPSHGTYDGERYIPNAEFEGEDRLLWKVNDGKNDSNVAVLTLLVGNVTASAAPTAIDRTVVVTEDTPISITVTCSDPENDPLLYQLISKPTHGDYEWQPPNTVVYTPTANYTGTDSFTFRSHDGQNFSNVSMITLTVSAVNDAPVALAQAISTTRNTNVSIPLVATDVESDTIAYSIAISPTHGTLAGDMANLLYTPDANFVGQDSVQFMATDALGAFSLATISITVNPSNTAPLAQAQELTTTADNALAINLGASDVDGDVLTYTLLSTPTHGTLVGADAAWVYIAEVGFVGDDGLVFEVNDGALDSITATVQIHVAAPPNEASVVGLAYDDQNGNGQPDEGEQGANNVQVSLVSSTGRVVRRATANFSGQTDDVGAWRFDGVPFGQYTLQMASNASTQLAAPLQIPITIDQRGVTQANLAAIRVTGRAFFLPLAAR